MRSHVPDSQAVRVRVGAVDFACLSWGDGPLVVLVHGFPDTARTWDVVGPRVAALGYRAVAPYTRGIAPSSIPADGAYDDMTLGRDVLGLIDALGARDAVVIGHDFGASAAYVAAALAPQRVKRLVTGHFLHREHPEAFLDVLLPFLAP